MPIQYRRFYANGGYSNNNSDPASYNDRESYVCPKCGAELEVTDDGCYKGYNWENVKCSDPECEYKEINEP